MAGENARPDPGSDPAQAALGRVLLYCRTLGVSAEGSLKTAAEALGRSRAAAERGAMAEAMAAAREAIPEAAVRPETPSASGPPVRRSSMAPEHMDRKPWQTFLLRQHRAFVLHATPVLNSRLYFLVLLYVMLVILDLTGLNPI